MGNKSKEISRILEIINSNKKFINESITGDIAQEISSFLRKYETSIVRDYNITAGDLRRISNLIEKNEIWRLPKDTQKLLSQYILSREPQLSKSIYDSAIYSWLKKNTAYGYVDLIDSIRRIQARTNKTVEEILEVGNSGKPIMVDKNGNPDWFAINTLKGKIEKEILNLEKKQKFEFEVSQPPRKSRWEKLGDLADKKIGHNKYGEAFIEGFFKSHSGAITTAKALRNLIFNWKKTFTPLTDGEKDIALKWFSTGVADWPNAKKVRLKLGFLPWALTVTTQMFRKWLIISTALTIIGFIREIIEGLGPENPYLEPGQGGWQKIKDGFATASFFSVNPLAKLIEVAWYLVIEPSVRNQGKFKDAWLEYFNFKEKDLKRKKQQLENGHDVDLGSEVESDLDKMPNKNGKHNFNEW